MDYLGQCKGIPMIVKEAATNMKRCQTGEMGYKYRVCCDGEVKSYYFYGIVKVFCKNHGTQECNEFEVNHSLRHEYLQQSRDKEIIG